MGRKVEVYYTRVGLLLPAEEMTIGRREVAAIGKRYCVVDRETAERHTGNGQPNFVLASRADSDRWRVAVEALLRVMEAVRDQERQASRHLHPPRRRVRRTVWKIRHARRNRRLRANYAATLARLREDVLATCRDYREQSRDLHQHIEDLRELRKRHSREERKRWEREDREREQRDRQARAAAMAEAPGEPVWAYQLYTSYGDVAEHRRFRIRLQTIEGSQLTEFDTLVRTGRGLTPLQVHSALLEERSLHPDTPVEWAYDTRKALEEWHIGGDVVNAWQALTGQRLDPYPRPPAERESQRFHGPSSNYFTAGGFGPH